MSSSPIILLWALPAFILSNNAMTVHAFQINAFSFVENSKLIIPTSRHEGVIHKGLHAYNSNCESMSMILETQSKGWKPPRTRKHLTRNSIGNKFVPRGSKSRHNKRKPCLRAEEANEVYYSLLGKTHSLLDMEAYPLKSLVDSKWHYSTMRSWAKLIEDSGSSVFPIPTNKNHNSKQSRGSEGMTHLPSLIDTILDRIIIESTSGNTDIRVTSEMYSISLKAWATNAAQGPDASSAAERCLAIVQHMQQQYETSNNPGVKPDSYHLTTALGAFAKACAFYNSPCSRTFAKASAICNSPRSNGGRVSHNLAEQAHGALVWMEGLSNTGRNIDAKPNALAYARVMDAFAKSGDKDAGKKAEALLRYMENHANVTPNTYCYNMVLNAYTRQKRREGAVQSAERILTELEQIYRDTHNPSLQPDVVSYTSLVSAWARSNQKGYGARRAEAIVKRMEAFATECGNPSIRPTPSPTTSY